MTEMATASRCPAKHTKPQIPDEDFKCPKCGTTPDTEEHQFYIQEPSEQADPNCPLLHDADGLGCDKCNYGVSGKRFAAVYAKQQRLVSCEHCKGTGLVEMKP